MKRGFNRNEFYPNKKQQPALMTSEHSLKVIIENNAEEVERYENTKAPSKPQGELKFEPTKVAVSLHSPKAPADIGSRSFKVPLGQSTTVYITPSAREIDESGRKLTEAQRNCRLQENTESLQIYKVYTRDACLFECRMKYAKENVTILEIKRYIFVRKKLL